MPSTPAHPSPRGADTMSSALPQAERYHRWIFSLVQPHLARSVLEIGFGYGQYTPWIANHAREVCAADIDEAMIRKAPPLPRNVRLAVADLSDSEFAKICPGPYDTIVCLNILEHVEDDREALAHLHSVLAPGGRLCLLVPAHPALYGAMDRLAGHFRRYSRQALVAVLESAGFQTESSAYLNPLGGLGWWINSRTSSPDTLSTPAINRQILFFDRWILPFSRLLTPLTRTCGGQSVWAVAVKKDAN